MTTATGTTAMSDQMLVNAVLEYDVYLVYYRDERATYVNEIERRLDERGARSLPVEGATVERPLGTAVYDYAALAKLRELHSAKELGKAYTVGWDETIPEHEVWHEEKWDGSALNKLARDLGGETRAIIEAATTRNPAAVKVTATVPSVPPTP